LDEAFFLRCSHYTCYPSRPHDCDCQADSSINGQKLAYTGQGLFRFNNFDENERRTEVIECNKYCKCATDCFNRASQKPRIFDIQIFKTLYCGWGIRSPRLIPKGTVLGFFTGKIVERKFFEDIQPGELYAFDIDVGEAEGNEDHARYSVDATHSGNWTRFINHSCDPNIVVYNAVIDVPSSHGLSRVVFAACRDIPALEEFSVDYHPGALETSDHTKHLDFERIRCYCGSSNCRGFLFN